MGRNDICFCGSGKKVKHCHRDINEKSLVAKMLALYAAIDERNANAQSICSPGCSQCCNDGFEVYFAEYLTILHFLCIDSLTRSAVASKWLDVVSQKTTNGSCVFLDQKDQLCKIYAVRPLVCRCYGATIQASMYPCEPMEGVILGSRKENGELGIDAEAQILGLINEDEYDAIDQETYRIFMPYQVDGKSGKILMGQPKVMTLWLKGINAEGFISSDKVKSLLEKATRYDVNQFIIELQR